MDTTKNAKRLDEAAKLDHAARLAQAPARQRAGHGSYATIGARMAERQERTGWSGCSCGSREGVSRPSDCWTCRHDAE